MKQVESPKTRKKFMARKEWDKKDLDFLEKNHKTMPYDDIAQTLGRTRHSIRSKCCRLGWVGFRCFPIHLGEKFGRLTVIEKTPKKNKRRASYYLCQCDCGDTKVIEHSSLRSGYTQSCGCLHSETCKEIHRLMPGESGYNKLEQECKTKAEERNIPYKLRTEEYRNLIKQNCFWCETKPRLWNFYYKKDGKGKRTVGTVTDEWADQNWIYINGIDRLDNNHTIGYILSNSVSCCPDCNYAKGAMDFYRWCSFLERFRLDYTKNILEKLEKTGITLPPKNNS